MAASNTQFTIAVHILAALANAEGEASSAGLAASVNATPSFVRRILARLVKADLVHATRGPTGCCQLTRKPKEISLAEVYRAVGSPPVFAIHQYPSRKICPVSCGIKTAMENVLDEAQTTLEKSLKSKSLADVLKDIYTG